MDTGISLTEALRELRQELYAAQSEGANEQFRFEVEQAELTLEVEFRRDGNGKVKVDVGALGTKVGGEAGGGLGSTRRQTLTLTLQVRDEPPTNSASSPRSTTRSSTSTSPRCAMKPRPPTASARLPEPAYGPEPDGRVTGRGCGTPGV
ncbi:trypco2 family protein [Streptomyces sp. NPDC007164]|uniref:trypco2 family protein n=1 Tax=Streptomyces sp. NPDC007164 TaxID=3156918 RepID=UPI0033E80D51